MSGDPKVLLAMERAALARQQLTADLTELRTRLSPGTLAGNVASGIQTKAVEAVETSVDTIRENRWAAAGIATVGALFLARRPIAAMFDASTSHDDETSAHPARLKAKPALAKDQK